VLLARFCSLDLPRLASAAVAADGSAPKGAVVVGRCSTQLWRRVSAFPGSLPDDEFSARRVRLIVAAIVILVGFAPLLHCDGLQLGRNGNDQICFILLGSVFLNGAKFACNPEPKRFQKLNCRSSSRARTKHFIHFFCFSLRLQFYSPHTEDRGGVISERVSCPLSIACVRDVCTRSRADLGLEESH
jgi:hypothetical protein